MDEKERRPRALIVTALPIEYAGVRHYLRNMREEELPHGMIAEVGVLDATESEWSVWLIEAGMGNEASALETDRAVAFIAPSVVMFVGIAGGRKDVAIGDVVVASKVYGYEAGKETQTFVPRPDALEPSYRILQLARAVARQGRWQDRLELSSDDPTPQVLVKPLAAGEKVVANRRSLVARHLDKHYGDTAAVEMEGHGFHRAMHARPGIEAIVIRGVSDLLNAKAVADASGGQLLAVRSAAAFAVALLVRLNHRPRGAGVPMRFDDGAVTAEGGVKNQDVDFWDRLHTTAADLYDQGPLQEGIWERAGGEYKRLRLAQSASGVWYDAIKLLRQGSGKALSARSLLEAMRQDFPESEEIRALLTLIGANAAR